MPRNIAQIVEKLHKINFGEKGILKIGDDYNYEGYCSNGKQHFDCSNGMYCQMCDDELKPTFKPGYKFTYVSHGTHSDDYLKAYKDTAGEEIDTMGWQDYPVAFILENPSTFYDIYYNQNDTNGTRGKCPAQFWYWGAYGLEKPVEYPENFSQGHYGGLFFL